MTIKEKKPPLSPKKLGEESKGIALICRMTIRVLSIGVMMIALNANAQQHKAKAVKIEFAYDDAGNRIRRFVPIDPNSNTGTGNTEGDGEMANGGHAKEDAGGSIDVDVWPNPTSGDVNVAVEETVLGLGGITEIEILSGGYFDATSIKDYEVIVNDQTGKEILHTTVHEPKFNLDLSNQKAGNYNMKVIAHGQNQQHQPVHHSASRQIIKQ